MSIFYLVTLGCVNEVMIFERLRKEKRKMQEADILCIKRKCFENMLRSIENCFEMSTKFCNFALAFGNRIAQTDISKQIIQNTIQT